MILCARTCSPGFIFLFSILVAREIYPYAVSNPNVDDKYQVQIIAEGLGGPTCLHFIDSENLLLCDRDGGRILFDGNFSSQVLIEGLHHPHGVLVENDTLFVSESGRLTKYDFEDNLASNPEILVEGIPSKNHQTNTINKLPNGTLIGIVAVLVMFVSKQMTQWSPPMGQLFDGEHGILARV